MYKYRLRSALVLIVLLCFVGIGYKIIDRPKIVKGNSETTILEGNKKEFSDFGAKNFTCTGLTWDSTSNTFWIGDYGAKDAKDIPMPRIVQVSSDLTKIEKIVDLSEVLGENDNLQGISYDEMNDSLWIAVGDTCKNISKDGKLNSQINLGKYSKYKSNGICVDGDTLWVLFYSKYIVQMDKNGKILAEYKFNYKDQDMIFNAGNELLVTVGADYSGDNNFVVSFNKETGEKKVKYQVKGAYAVEGILVINDKMYILNDGLYHNAKIKESYFSIYDLK